MEKFRTAAKIILLVSMNYTRKLGKNKYSQIFSIGSETLDKYSNDELEEMSEKYVIQINEGETNNEKLYLIFKKFKNILKNDNSPRLDDIYYALEDLTEENEKELVSIVIDLLNNPFATIF